MKKDILLQIKIPEDVELSLEKDRIVTVKHKEKEITESFMLGKLKLELDGKKLLIKDAKGTFVTIIEEMKKNPELNGYDILR